MIFAYSINSIYSINKREKKGELKLSIFPSFCSEQTAPIVMPETFP